MKYQSPVSLAANTPINLLEDRQRKVSSRLIIRMDKDADATKICYIKVGYTATSELADYILYPGEGIKIPKSCISHQDAIVSIVTPSTGVKIYFHMVG